MENKKIINGTTKLYELQSQKKLPASLLVKTIDEILFFHLDASACHSVYELRGVGEKSVENLKDIIHSYGYLFECEKKITLDTPIRNLKYSKHLSDFLLNKTVGEVLKYDINPNHLNSLYKFDGLRNNTVSHLIDYLHQNGFIFDCEKRKEHEEEKVIPVTPDDNIKDISFYPLLKLRLEARGIKTVRDLLHLSISKDFVGDTNHLYNVRGFGKKRADELIHYIHSQGLLFDEEEKITQSKKDKRELDFADLNEESYLTDLKMDKTITKILLAANIYTLKDLINLSIKKEGNSLYDIKGLSNWQAKKVINYIHTLGYQFASECKITLQTKISDLKDCSSLSRYLKDKTIEEVLQFDLTHKGSNSLYRLPSVGPKNVQKIENVLHSYGYVFDCEKVNLDNTFTLTMLLKMMDANVVASEFYGKIISVDDFITNPFVKYFRKMANVVCKKEDELQYTDKEIILFLLNQLIEHKKKLSFISSSIEETLNLRK